MRAMKGWVCKRCGSENRTEDRRCLACLQVPQKRPFARLGRCLANAASAVLSGLSGDAVIKAACVIRYILMAALVVLAIEAVEVLSGSSISVAWIWDHATASAWEIYHGMKMRMEHIMMMTDTLEVYFEKLKLCFEGL